MQRLQAELVLHSRVSDSDAGDEHVQHGMLLDVVDGFLVRDHGEIDSIALR